VTLKQVIEGQSPSNGAERHENGSQRRQGRELVDCNVVFPDALRVAIGVHSLDA
jgi:hypothetical protein